MDLDDLAAPQPAATGTMRSAVATLEKRMILKSLQRNTGNRTRTAEDLGLSRLGLRKKMQRYGLEPPS